MMTALIHTHHCTHTMRRNLATALVVVGVGASIVGSTFPASGFVVKGTPSCCRHGPFSRSTAGTRPPPSLQNSRLFDDDPNQDEDEGQILARAFYQQMRERQEKNSEGTMVGDDSRRRDDGGSDTDNNGNDEDEWSTRSEAEARRQNRRPFSQRQVISVASTNISSDRNSSSNDEFTSPKIKYTGRSDQFFGSGIKNEDQQRRSPRQKMMEQEFGLVGRASSGASLGIQAGIVMLTLIFYIYVGLAGGIGSGDRQDTVEDEIVPFERVMPVPIDREASVWL